MKPVRVGVCAALASLLLAPPALAAPEESKPAPDLFTPHRAGPGEESKLPTVKRSRSTSLNPEAVERVCHEGGDVTLNLFDGVTVRVTETSATPTESGPGLRWTGQVAGQSRSMVSLAVVEGCDSSPDAAVLAGGIRLQDGNVYGIDSDGPGQVTISERKRGVKVHVDDAVPVPPKKGADRRSPERRAGKPVVDVLALYNGQALKDYHSESGFRAHYEDVLGGMNAALHASGVALRMRLVGVARTDTKGLDIRKALGALYDPGDGVMDEVPAKRDKLGADLVQLDKGTGGEFISTANGYGLLLGIAYTPVPPTSRTPDTGLSVVSPEPGSYTEAHEMGHNFGAYHDWETTGRKLPAKGTPEATYAYNHGYVHPKKKWHTIMGYDGPCDGCPAIPRYSNPSVKYQGDPTGVPAKAKYPADTARMLNRTAPAVAAYRPTAKALRTFTLTARASRGGTVSESYPGPYAAGARVAVTARPSKGYRFTGWYVGKSRFSTATRVTLEVRRNLSVTARFSPVPKKADLRLTGKAKRLTRKKGTYVFTVRNQGPATATTPVLTVRLPKGLTYRSAKGARCKKTRCTLPSLTKGRSKKITLNVRVRRSGKPTVSAQTTSRTPDPNRTNNKVKLKKKIR